MHGGRARALSVLQFTLSILTLFACVYIVQRMKEAERSAFVVCLSFAVHFSFFLSLCCWCDMNGGERDIAILFVHNFIFHYTHRIRFTSTSTTIM